MTSYFNEVRSFRATDNRSPLDSSNVTPRPGRALLAPMTGRGRRKEGEALRRFQTNPRPRNAGDREGGLNHEFRVILFSFLYVMLVLGGIGLWEVYSRQRLRSRLIRVRVPLPPVRRSRRRSCRGAVHRNRAAPPYQTLTRAGPPPSLRLFGKQG